MKLSNNLPPWPTIFFFLLSFWEIIEVRKIWNCTLLKFRSQHSKTQKVGNATRVLVWNTVPWSRTRKSPREGASRAMRSIPLPIRSFVLPISPWCRFDEDDGEHPGKSSPEKMTRRIATGRRLSWSVSIPLSQTKLYLIKNPPVCWTW